MAKTFGLATVGFGLGMAGGASFGAGLAADSTTWLSFPVCVSTILSLSFVFGSGMSGG
jgi:hypothetical protein